MQGRGEGQDPVTPPPEIDSRSLSGGDVLPRLNSDIGSVATREERKTDMSNEEDQGPAPSELLLAALSDTLMKATEGFVSSLPLVRLAVQAEGEVSGDREGAAQKIDALSNWTITLVHLCSAATVLDFRYNGVIGHGVKTITEDGKTSTVYALGSVLRTHDHLNALEAGSVIRFRDRDFGGRYVIAEKHGGPFWETLERVLPTSEIKLPVILLSGPPKDAVEGLLHGLVEG